MITIACYWFVDAILLVVQMIWRRLCSKQSVMKRASRMVCDMPHHYGHLRASAANSFLLFVHSTTVVFLLSLLHQTACLFVM